MLVLAYFGYLKILPFLVQLKKDTITLLLNWIFYLCLFIFLVIFIIGYLSYRKKKVERLEKERIEDEKFWREYHKREEDYKKLFYHPEPKKLLPFASEIIKQDEEPKEEKIINVDLDKIYYKRNNINKYEIEYLINQGYTPFSYKSICTNKKENYLLKPRFNETLNHMITIYDISEYLNKKEIKHEKFTTRMPDIVIYLRRKKIAIEVETGTVMTNMKKFKEKIKSLNENYGENWYFIVTNRNLIKKYRKFGKVIDPRCIKGQVDKILKKA